MVEYVCNPKTGHVIQVKKKGRSTFATLHKDPYWGPKLAKSPKSSSKEALKPCKSPKRKSSKRKRKSPKRKSPKRKRKSPKRKSPKRKSPKRKSSKRKSPKRKSPKRKRKSPKRSRTPVKCGNPKGWGSLKPGGHERTVMLRDCGEKCFLGRDKTFPICAAGSCSHNQKGISAACMRARQMSSPRAKKVKGRSKAYYNRIAQRALDLRNAQLKSSGGGEHRAHHCPHHQGHSGGGSWASVKAAAEAGKARLMRESRDEESDVPDLEAPPVANEETCRVCKAPRERTLDGELELFCGECGYRFGEPFAPFFAGQHRRKNDESDDESDDELDLRGSWASAKEWAARAAAAAAAGKARLMRESRDEESDVPDLANEETCRVCKAPRERTLDGELELFCGECGTRFFAGQHRRKNDELDDELDLADTPSWAKGGEEKEGALDDWILNPSRKILYEAWQKLPGTVRSRIIAGRGSPSEDSKWPDSRKHLPPPSKNPSDLNWEGRESKGDSDELDLADTPSWPKGGEEKEGALLQERQIGADMPEEYLEYCDIHETEDFCAAEKDLKYCDIHGEEDFCSAEEDLRQELYSILGYDADMPDEKSELNPARKILYKAWQKLSGRGSPSEDSKWPDSRKHLPPLRKFDYSKNPSDLNWEGRENVGDSGHVLVSKDEDEEFRLGMNKHELIKDLGNELTRRKERDLHNYKKKEVVQ